jgi:hypothetical protein
VEILTDQSVDSRVEHPAEPARATPSQPGWSKGSANRARVANRCSRETADIGRPRHGRWGRRARARRRKPTPPTRAPRREVSGARPSGVTNNEQPRKRGFSNTSHTAPQTKQTTRRHGPRRRGAAIDEGIFEGCEQRREERTESPRAIPGSRIRETRRTSDRQRGATNPPSRGGASRQGSEKLRRRNGSRRVAPFARRSRKAPGVDTLAHVGGDERMTEPTRGGFASPARRESSEGEAKRWRSRRAGPATDLGRGAPREDLESATGNGATLWRERGGQRTATGTTRYRTEYRCESNLESQANLTRATAQADSIRCSTL